MDQSSHNQTDALDSWLQQLREQLANAMDEMDPPPPDATLLGHTAEAVAADPTLITEPISQLFAGLKTVMEGVSGDEEAATAAEERIAAFQAYLIEHGVELPNDLPDLQTKVRQSYHEGQQQQQTALADSLSELAAALGQAVEEVVAVLEDEAAQFRQESGADSPAHGNERMT